MSHAKKFLREDGTAVLRGDRYTVVGLRDTPLREAYYELRGDILCDGEVLESDASWTAEGRYHGPSDVESALDLIPVLHTPTFVENFVAADIAAEDRALDAFYANMDKLLSEPPSDPHQLATEKMLAAERKAAPIVTGVLDYFPLALLEVAKCSKQGNEQHHPGTPLHWDRAKSTDEADALGRHLLDRGKFDTDGIRHSAKVAWRALALLQKELEQSKKETL